MSERRRSIHIAPGEFGLAVQHPSTRTGRPGEPAPRAGYVALVPDSSASKTALVVVDVLNPYEHEDADELAESMAAVVDNIAELVRRACEEGIPVVYVNDNYGQWNSSSQKLLQAGLDGRHPELVEPLRPPDDASFVIKARHSVFYETPLEYLLRQLGVQRIMLCGQVTEQCILYSALDAYVRHFAVAVPKDAVAAIDPGLAEAALEMMRRNMRADVRPVTACRLRPDPP